MCELQCCDYRFMPVLLYLAMIEQKYTGESSVGMYPGVYYISKSSFWKVKGEASPSIYAERVNGG